MNNTRTLAIVAVLTAATLVVGLTVAATMTTSASAGGKRYGQDKYMKRGQDSYKKDGQDTYNKGTRDNGNDGGSGNRNGNTVTILKAENKGSASGWDTKVNQEAENLICTHPSEDGNGYGGTCVSESQ